ncbi:hypothetical protein GJ496_001884 [Pomphorhynchus laevis]|nr:hypothetical protein GJ496_001884 [Pomphorhynchus laevis]
MTCFNFCSSRTCIKSYLSIRYPCTINSSSILKTLNQTRQKRQFFGRDGPSWFFISLFYSSFYFLLALLLTIMALFVMITIPKDRPKYILGESTMAVLTPLNPGLGLRPRVGKSYDLIKFHVGDGDNETLSRQSYIESIVNFLRPYQNTSTLRNCSEIPESQLPLSGPYESCLFYLEPPQCSELDEFGYENGEPCVLIKLNRIYGWTSDGASSCPTDDQKSDGKGSIKGPGNIRIKCQGETVTDVELIETIEYYSYNGNSQDCADIPNNKMYYPFRSQINYLSPYVWAKFNVKHNVLVSIICRAYAENIDSIQKMKMRGMLRFKLFIEDPNSAVNNRTN